MFLTYDNTTNTNVKITVKYYNHHTCPDIYVSIFPRGSNVRDLKRDLLRQGLAAYGWATR